MPESAQHKTKANGVFIQNIKWFNKLNKPSLFVGVLQLRILDL